VSQERTAAAHCCRRSSHAKNTSRCKNRILAGIGPLLNHSVIVNFQRATPIQLGARFVNPVFASEHLKQDFTQITPFRYLRDLGPATEVERIILRGSRTECL
jgi:hypothetical protein